jgi:hypothetical protein
MKFHFKSSNPPLAKGGVGGIDSRRERDEKKKRDKRRRLYIG